MFEFAGIESNIAKMTLGKLFLCYLLDRDKYAHRSQGGSGEGGFSEIFAWFS